MAFRGLLTPSTAQTSSSSRFTLASSSRLVPPPAPDSPASPLGLRLEGQENAAPRQSDTRSPWPIREELDQRLKDCQLKNSQLEIDLKSAHLRLQAHENRNTPGATKRKRSNQENITTLASLFAFTRRLWVDVSYTQLATAAQLADAGAPRQSAAEDLRRELFDLLPEEYSAQLTDNVFCKRFLEDMQAFRSGQQHKIREQAAHLIVEFDLSINTRVLTNHTLRGSNEDLKRLLGYNIDAPADQPRYSLFCPLIGENRFDTDIIVKVIQVIIFGPAAASRTPKKTSASLITKWGTRFKITPGVVAAAAVFSRWMISMDTSFKPSDGASHNNWQVDYEGYLTFLNNEGNMEFTTDLINRITNAVFNPDIGSHYDHQPHHNSRADEIQRALNMRMEPNSEDNSPPANFRDTGRPADSGDGNQPEPPIANESTANEQTARLLNEESFTATSANKPTGNINNGHIDQRDVDTPQPEDIEDFSDDGSKDDSEDDSPPPKKQRQNAAKAKNTVKGKNAAPLPRTRYHRNTKK
ncbi:hypothetical protein FRC18_002557 [Serendipita sp. 400]|nr:hypothetical protein FRC18_002557 [Serendipita sp. 400]